MSDTQAPTQSIEAEAPAIEGGRRLAPAFKRNIMIVAGAFGFAIVLIVAMILMRSQSESKGPSAPVQLATAAQPVPKGEGEQMSPAMRNAIEEKLQKEKKEREAKGETVHVSDEFVEPVEKVPPTETTAAGFASGAEQRPPGTYTQEELERIARRRAGLERQVGSLIATMDTNRTAPTRVSFSVASPSAAGPSNTGGSGHGPNSGPGGGMAMASAIVPSELVGMLEIVPAETASPIDSYKTPFASARIVSGKLAGAYLIGAIRQQEDGLQISFNQMRFRGKGYAINAIALDEKTSTNAMNANVDYRYLQRWVFPVGVAALGAYANAQAQTGSQTTMTINGQEVTRPAPTHEQARAAGVAAGLGLIARQVATEAAKPYRLQLEDRTFIGILFNSALSEGAPMAGTGMASASMQHSGYAGQQPASPQQAGTEARTVTGTPSGVQIINN